MAWHTPMSAEDSLALDVEDRAAASIARLGGDRRAGTGIPCFRVCGPLLPKPNLCFDVFEDL